MAALLNCCTIAGTGGYDRTQGMMGPVGMPEAPPYQASPWTTSFQPNKRFQVIAARWTQGGNLGYGQLVQDLDELLLPHAMRYATSYTEYRHFLPYTHLVPFEMGLYHAFTLVEIDRGVCEIMLEKFNDQLEIMLLMGEPQALHAHATMFRATGEPRELSAARPLVEHTRIQLGPMAGMQPVTVGDLRRWIMGSCANAWQPYDPISANCQHFALDAQSFLRFPVFGPDQQYRQGVLSQLKANGSALENVAADMRRDREVVMVALESSGLAIQFAHEELQANPDIVMAAVRQDGTAFRFASDELRENREFVMACVRTNGRALRYAADKLRKDRDVVLAAVRAEPLALEFAAENMRRDRTIVYTAVQLDGRALAFAVEELRRERELATVAVGQHGMALQFVPEAMQWDRVIVAKAIETHGCALRFAGEEYRQDRDLCLAAAARDGGALEFMADQLRRDREIVLTAVKGQGSALQFAHVDLRRDREIVLAAVRSDGTAVRFASQELQRDPEVLRARMV